jgi:two-component system cell cycle sensor histidine kinase/response regulator CckA
MSQESGVLSMVVNVLLVDDEPQIRKLLAHVLMKAGGYHVLTAASGEDALDLSRNRSERIDILITDIEMGEISGIQLYTQLAKERPRTAVLFVSAEADVFRESYPDWPFLNKPFVPKEFLTKLQEVHSAQ